MLEQAGFGVFQDEPSIRVGERWVERLDEALHACSAFIVLVGREGVRRWVSAEVGVALVRNLSPKDDANRLPIYPILLSGEGDLESLPLLLAQFQATHWTPGDHLPTDFIAALTQRLSRDATFHFDGCPFLGLSAFQRDDEQLFFGRRKESLDALACLGDQLETNPDQLSASGGTRYHRWLQIEGNSGAGKSSLVNAGILPLIEQGWLWARTGFDTFTLLGPMLPSKEPVWRLAQTLEHALVAKAQRQISSAHQRLMADSNELRSRLCGAKEKTQAFLLIVDQFEELFTFADDTEREQFDRLLTTALEDPDCPLFLISTVRADFLDRFELLPRLGEIYNSRCKRYFLQPISEQGLREIIEGPAGLTGLDVSKVSGLILKDARDEAGALPLVENALRILWDDLQTRRLHGAQQSLSADYYVTHGGIAGMLSEQADALLDRAVQEIPRSGRQAALELLFALTQVNEEGRHTRQRITRAAAVAAANVVAKGYGERVLNLLAGERDPNSPIGAKIGALRLVVTDRETTNSETPANGDTKSNHGSNIQYVDLIHETLLRARKDERTKELQPYWPTLFHYVDANRDRDFYRRQLKERARQWQQRRLPWGPFTGASLSEWWSYHRRRLYGDSTSVEERYLRAGLRCATLFYGVLALVLGFLGESTWWWFTVNNGAEGKLPPGYVVIKPLWALGLAIPLPEMKRIPSGSFIMGCKPGRDDVEGARCVSDESQPVKIDKPFSMGKYEVTFLQYDYYVWSQRRRGQSNLKFPQDQGWGRYNQPVIDVSWSDARAYARWLSEKTGKAYGLPTEVGWEYAARAGTDTAFWWGQDVKGKNANQANCRDCGSLWDAKQTAPVGSFGANPWGLHDTAGNVLEWVDDEYDRGFDALKPPCLVDKHENGDGIAHRGRVLRGGSWYRYPPYARAQYRSGDASVAAGFDRGFRVCAVAPIE